MRRAYDLSVLDTGGLYGALALQLLKLSDEILLVAAAELGAIFGARRALSHMREKGVSASEVKLVLSRGRRGSGFEREEIESALGIPAHHVLPNDPQTMEDALLEGRPVNPGSPYGKSLAALASGLLDRDGQIGSRTSSVKGLRSLLSRGS